MMSNWRVAIAVIAAMVAVRLAAEQILPSALAEGSVATDRAALEALYRAAQGPAWNNRTNWATDAPLSEWYGVRTDAGGRVVALELSRNRLTGILPEELAGLTRLEVLDMDGNNLGSQLPTALTALTNLRDIRLSNNDFAGEIPRRIGRLTSLKTLKLGYNDLTGPIPAEIGDLTGLRELSLDGNHLGGTIPAEIGNLVNLVEFELNRNNLTGRIPDEVWGLTKLSRLKLADNNLTGEIPGEVGQLRRLRYIELEHTGLRGPIPPELGELELDELNLSFLWGLTGRLPDGIADSESLSRVNIFATQACAPGDWRPRLEERDVDFLGTLCGTDHTVTVDVAILYTEAARETAGGKAGVETAIDLMIAETNRAYADSGVRHRLRVVGRQEVDFDDTNIGAAVDGMIEPNDGVLDEAQTLRARTGADIVHLIMADAPGFCGSAILPGAYAATVLDCGGLVLAHEIGHNMGLHHDRFYDQILKGIAAPHPAWGYVNHRVMDGDPPLSARWHTIMAYRWHCRLVDVFCSPVMRFSNPRQQYLGDPLGVPFGAANASDPIYGPADAAAVLNTTMRTVSEWGDRRADTSRANRPPTARSGALPNREVELRGHIHIDLSQAFSDPDGDRLRYSISSSTPTVVAVHLVDLQAVLTATGEGGANITASAADPEGLAASASFTVTVRAKRPKPPFTDDPLVPGETPLKAVHFTELRERIAALTSAVGLTPLRWTDPVLVPGTTPVRLVHLLEMRRALDAAYFASGRRAPVWTDPAPIAGETPIRAVHLAELRATILALE